MRISSSPLLALLLCGILTLGSSTPNSNINLPSLSSKLANSLSSKNLVQDAVEQQLRQYIVDLHAQSLEHANDVTEEDPFEVEGSE